MISHERYERMTYCKCGNSGLYLSKFAIGLWNSFGGTSPYDKGREIILTAINEGMEAWTAESIALLWDKPEGNGDVLHYRIVLDGRCIGTTRHSDFTIKNLCSCNDYQVSVQAVLGRQLFNSLNPILCYEKGLLQNDCKNHEQQPLNT